MKTTDWSQDEIDLLVKSYLGQGATYVSKKLNRTIEAVKTKARRLGLISYSPQKWTDEELMFLKENYGTKGCNFIAMTLNRHKGSVSKKARELSLKSSNKLLFTKEELDSKVKESYCISDLMEKLNRTKSGAGVKTIKKYIFLYDIDTSHFNPYKKNIERLKSNTRLSLEYWLQEGTKIGSSNLKAKLYKSGLKQRICEKCGQGEIWNGEKISLILDHINGHPSDNRLENLRIVCPNCEATLLTHCRGYKKNKKIFKEPKKPQLKIKENNKTPKLKIIHKSKEEASFLQRKVDRPPFSQLMQEVSENGYSATGRKYGVSDNAIRKWIKQYKKENV
jgi:hypothetical protein